MCNKTGCRLAFALLLIAAITPVKTLYAQSPDSLHRLDVRLNAPREVAIDGVLAALPRVNFAPTGMAVPHLVLASPLEMGGVTVRIQLVPAPNGMTDVILSAVVLQGLSGGGVTMGGTGSSSVTGGGIQSVERGSRRGRNAWARMMELRDALQALDSLRITER